MLKTVFTFFVLEGQIEVADQLLDKRDGIGIWNTEEISLKFNTKTKVLVMEIPLAI